MPNKRKPSVALICALAIGLVLFYCAFKLRSHQSVEWDEGVYLTTFQSIQQGFPAYQQTYLSQPPGFLITIYPLWMILGSNLEAARLGMFVYSLLGLMAIVWIGWELDNVVFGFIALGILYLIPIYTTEILTLHTDSLPSAFSALALAATFRFRNSIQYRAQWHWLIIASIAAAFAVLIKADVSVLPAISLVMLAIALDKSAPGKSQKPLGKASNFVKIGGVFAAGFLASLLVATLPFGLNAVWANVVALRVQAATASRLDPNLFLDYFHQQTQLMILLALAIPLSYIAAFRKPGQRFPLTILAVWVASSIAILLVYHPLIMHHLVLLALPIAIYFSYALYSVLSSVADVRWILVPATLFILIVLVERLNYAINFQEVIPNQVEIKAINLVNTYTTPGDYVVSDDGIITGLTKRLPPPALTDLSYVRISSGNLTADEFAESLAQYRPKLVFAWVDRLVYLPGFSEIMAQYHYRLLDDSDSHHLAYIMETSGDLQNSRYLLDVQPQSAGVIR